MQKIQILGIKEHQKTELLKSNTAQALKEEALDWPIEEVFELKKLLTANIVGVPALKIGDKVISQQEIPSIEDLCILFRVILKNKII